MNLSSDAGSPLPDAPEESAALVALSLIPGVGPGRIRLLVHRFGSAAAALEAPRRVLANLEGLGEATADAIRAFDGYDLVHEQWVRAQQVDARLVTEWDDDYPEALRTIYDPPVFLWVRGAFAPADARAVAIVGSRQATDLGKRIAEQFAGELAARGYTIVSGLAYGIDAAAHAAALAAGGRSIAVLGSGADRIYPSRHLPLALAMLDAGAVVSEYPLGATPDAVHFPRRNRIVSGLCLGTLVVEAYEKGGALITAGLALEQNREVFAVPGSIASPASAGCHRLIQRGHAKLVQTVDDVLAEIEPAYQATEATPAPPPDLNAAEQQLFDALGPEPIHIDTLCARTGLDTSSALVYLLNLEFKGLVYQMAGKMFYRA